MAITQTAPKFKTSDGRVFLSLNEAEGHEAYLGNREVIEAYIDHSDVGAPLGGAFRKHLPAFWAFADAYVPGTFDIAAFDAAAKAKADAKAAEKAAAAEPVATTAPAAEPTATDPTVEVLTAEPAAEEVHG